MWIHCACAVAGNSEPEGLPGYAGVSQLTLRAGVTWSTDAAHLPRARSVRGEPRQSVRYRYPGSARLLQLQGNSLGQIAAKTGIPKTSLHRYFDKA